MLLKTYTIVFAVYIDVIAVIL